MECECYFSPKFSLTASEPSDLSLPYICTWLHRPIEVCYKALLVLTLKVPGERHDGHAPTKILQYTWTNTYTFDVAPSLCLHIADIYPSDWDLGLLTMHCTWLELLPENEKMTPLFHANNHLPFISTKTISCYLMTKKKKKHFVETKT